MDIEFANRHVVVSGGAGALGAAVVQRLIDAGAICHIPVRRRPTPQAFPLGGHERVHIVDGVDLTDEAAVEAFYRGVPSLWASVQSAGGFTMAPVVETSLAQFRQMIDQNAVTCFLCCREAVRRIRASGGGGRLVNVAARPALVPTPGLSAYTASKAAVAWFTVGLAEELARESIWVNAVVPSIMDTAANRTAMPDADYGAWPKVEAVAATIAFLASPQNAVTRGALVPVYGKA